MVIDKLIILISQYTQISNHDVVHLKQVRYVNYISIKLEKMRRKAVLDLQGAHLKQICKATSKESLSLRTPVSLVSAISLTVEISPRSTVI